MAALLLPLPMARRVVPVTGRGPAREVSVGDLCVLDRPSLGRRRLLRLVSELALRGAAGLIISEEAVAPLPATLRSSIEERIPLLVVSSDWERARSWLLDSDPSAARMDADSVLRAVLRGASRGGPLPGQLDPSRPTQAVAIVAHPDGPASLSLGRIEEIAVEEAQFADPRAHVLCVEDLVTVLSAHYGRGHDPKGIGRALHCRLTRALPGAHVTIGEGRPYPGIPGLRRTYREAKWAATAGEMLWGGGRVVSFRELGIYGLLEPFVSDPATTDTQDVEKLLDYDRRNQTALVPTIEAYFDGGRSGDVAASLFVHRNTIAYRLRAVRRVTGLDIVQDADARLLLEVQIRLARLWGILPAGSARRTGNGRRQSR
jgi:hypothetical protein